MELNLAVINLYLNYIMLKTLFFSKKLKRPIRIQ